ncbi:uncharacterized protein VICG_02111 [Vittaforma corneae ATCC 50505]|uniref:MI domain-containing protein n=1 Tax=Vittaforma corneae (strain ATCC 50505) TaxID=993615 RepID=L2GJ04_VITCO|nr:uncharacterized protein VICG_02111 [Vittaforma corneae ATCC 50505]ELA40851.1 hypothetical protein VICG_02111 [Vittaforma corneae ATCC 50505]
MFKRAKQVDENVFKQPRLKATHEVKTHLRERTETEKIYHLFSAPNKRKTVFRMILSLKQSELEKNVYMLAENLLGTLIADKSIDRLFYMAFSRLLKTGSTSSMKKLCADHLKAQMCSDRSYSTFLEFLMRHFKSAIADNKNEIAEFVDDKSLKSKVLSLKEKTPSTRVSFNEAFYYTR